MTWRGLSDFEDRLERLNPLEDRPQEPDEGDVDWLDEGRSPRDAAVLIGLVPREDNDLNVVLTLRPETMPSHAGQVAFPGGKRDPGDPTLVYTALREAEEEVGVIPGEVELIGRSGPYITGSGYRVMPVVGRLPPNFIAKPDPYEVAAVFETPLSFLMNPDNHEEHRRMWEGRERRYFVMPHAGYHIWGVTAGIIRAFFHRLYGQEP